jgi:hypothetical protein
MLSTFVLAVNVPDLVRTPAGRWQWTELFVASAIGGAAFLVAHSYRGDRWVLIQPAWRTPCSVQPPR